MVKVKTWTFEQVKAMNGGDARKTIYHLEDLVRTKRILWARAKNLDEIQAYANDFEEEELILSKIGFN